MSACKAERGPTICSSEGRCMCREGWCANAWGECIKEPGKFIGTHAIKFEKPYKLHKPYIGVGDKRWGTTYLAATGDGTPQWKMALTAAGFVRFESTQKANHVIT